MSSCPSSDSTPRLDSAPLLVTLCMRTRDSWTSTCHSLCITFTTESLMLAPLRSFADGGFQRSTKWCLTRKQPTEPWMTSRRALKSCSTTEPTSSKPRRRRRSARL